MRDIRKLRFKGTLPDKDKVSKEVIQSFHPNGNTEIVTHIELIPDLVNAINDLYEELEYLKAKCDEMENVILKTGKVIAELPIPESNTVTSTYDVQVAIIEKDRSIGVIVKVDNYSIEPLTVKNVIYCTNNDKPITINQTKVVAEHSIGEIHSYNIQYQVQGVHVLKVTLNVNGKDVTVEKQFTIK